MNLDGVLARLGRGVTAAPGAPRERSTGGLSGAEYTLPDLVLLREPARRLRLAGRVTPVSWRAGMHVSRIRGRGMSFAESRPYQPGDDMRLIDWRVTARSGRTHTKVFEEEKERPVVLVAAFSASMYFGTRTAFKHVVAAEVSALIGWASLVGGDRIGALLASPGRHLELRPAPGRRALMRLLDALAGLSEAPPTTESAPALDAILFRAGKVVRPGSLVFMVGDFYDFDEAVARHIAGLTQHSDVVLCQVLDQLETGAPPPGSYPVSDGRRLTQWRVPANVHEPHRNPIGERLEAAPRRIARQFRCPYGLISAGWPVVDQLDNVLAEGPAGRVRSA